MSSQKRKKNSKLKKLKPCVIYMTGEKKYACLVISNIEKFGIVITNIKRIGIVITNIEKLVL